VEASNGPDAVERVKQQDIDVVVSDVHMPDIDGIELLRMLHENDPDLPVLLISGDPDVTSAMKAVEYGALEYLAKPVDLEKLFSSVSRAVGVRRHKLESKRELDQYRSGERARSSMPSSEPKAWSGALLGGRYRIGRLLGEGGMGRVYEAVREDFAQMRVAIKLLHPEFSARPEILARFRREAETVAAVDHPNIVRILDFQAVEGEPAFLVMERLVGASLAQTISTEGPLAPRRAAFVVSQALGALAAAHRMNVIHRDLKPENVFLIEMAGIGDVVKLLDFGIAKVLSAPGESQLTQTGVVLGTPPYMAPEHARGAAVDVRTDVYAAGCLLYEALTGRQPFTAQNYNALLFAIQETEPVPVRDLLPDLDSELSAVIVKAMSKDPAQRFQTADSMARALAAWAPSRAEPSSPPAESSNPAFARTEARTSQKPGSGSA
jgi:serine/threonine protein kinase